MEYIELANTEFKKPVDDYLRVATASPEIKIADIPYNIQAIGEAYEQAKAEQAELVVMPELCLTGYSAADLFHNMHVLEQTEKGVSELAKQTLEGPAMVVGAPLRHNGLLYNCAVFLAEGRVAGVVPKSHLPNYKEFYEYRWFTEGDDTIGAEMTLNGDKVPFGTDVLFNLNGTTIGTEICEDAWAVITPAAFAALNGAQVIVNLSASNELIGKTEYRRDNIIAGQAGRLICAYVFASAGRGESVADVIYGGHQAIAENGHIVKERPPHDSDTAPLVYDVDRTHLDHDRIVNKTFSKQAAKYRSLQPYRTITISAPQPTDGRLLRFVDPMPFVPSNPEELDNVCEQIFENLARALAQRINDAQAKALVIGLSGGLDSTLALLIAKYATEVLGKPASFIHTITMPGPASSEQTQDNAILLAEAMGTTHKVIPISDIALQTLGMIGHDQQTEDITYENTQARVRTLLLMNYANLVGGFVQGTGDMSENAVGWCTFNGDQMSMFNPNAQVPKTLVRHLVDWYKERRSDETVRSIIHNIRTTKESPELTGRGDLSQATEDNVGPYNLNDFYLFDHLRYGTRPSKMGYLALQAFKDTYDKPTIGLWLDKFLYRHTNSQWKREEMPNGTKTGSVAESPRGDLRMAPNTSPNWYK